LPPISIYPVIDRDWNDRITAQQGNGNPFVEMFLEIERADREMPTWQDEFVRLSELHRHEVERWLEGANNANAVIDAGETEKAFLIRWVTAGEPGRNEQIPE